MHRFGLSRLKRGSSSTSNASPEPSGTTSASPTPHPLPPIPATSSNQRPALDPIVVVPYKPSKNQGEATASALASTTVASPSAYNDQDILDPDAAGEDLPTYAASEIPSASSGDDPAELRDSPQYEKRASRPVPVHQRSLSSLSGSSAGPSSRQLPPVPGPPPPPPRARTISSVSFTSSSGAGSDGSHVGGPSALEEKRTMQRREELRNPTLSQSDSNSHEMRSILEADLHGEDFASPTYEASPSFSQLGTSTLPSPPPPAFGEITTSSSVSGSAANPQASNEKERLRNMYERHDSVSTIYQPPPSPSSHQMPLVAPPAASPGPLRSPPLAYTPAVQSFDVTPFPAPDSPTSTLDHDSASFPPYSPHPLSPNGQSGSFPHHQQVPPMYEPPSQFGTPLDPTDLQRIDLGPKAEAHAESPITCMLSLLHGHFLLIGTENGLKVIIDDSDHPAYSIWTGLPVWDLKILRIAEGESKTPTGAVLVVCGVKEKKSEIEARVYKLESIIGLARWCVSQRSSSGLDLNPKSKGKGKAINPTEKATANDFFLLTKGKELLVTTFCQDDQMLVAAVVGNQITLHTGYPTTSSGAAFRVGKSFYLPAKPDHLTLLEIGGGKTPSRASGIGSLTLADDRLEDRMGILVGLGGKALVIKVSNSSVVDPRIPLIKGDWYPMQRAWIATEQVYTFTRGTQSVVYPSPLNIPIATEPMAQLWWPETPLTLVATSSSMSTSMAGPTSLRLTLAGRSGNLHVHHFDLAAGRQIAREAVSVRVQEQVTLLQDGGMILDEGVMVSLKHDDKDWRISRLEALRGHY